MTVSLGLDIGSNSVGSAWVDTAKREIHVGVSVFPAGVEESDDKRGEPRNAKRRTARRTRVTLARRSKRKRELRLKLISTGLLPPEESKFRSLLKETNPWILRQKALMEPLSPHEFGRVLLHLAQRRGAIGFDSDADDQGKMKKAVTHAQVEMLTRYGSAEAKQNGQALQERIKVLSEKKRRTDQESLELEKACDDLKHLCESLLKQANVTFGRLMADLRDERRHELRDENRNPKRSDKGNPSDYHDPIRNRRDSFEFHGDRSLIRDEFAKLWDAQKRCGGPLAELLTEELRLAFDNESTNSVWRHQGLLFGQRRTYWDTGTLGRCVLEPTERCVPHADMYASRYLVVETVNNLKVIERGKEARFLDVPEREQLKKYLSGPLGVMKKGKNKGLPKHSVTVSDLREQLGWGPGGKTAQFRFNIEDRDEERDINTDWFSREIIHGAVTLENWKKMPEPARERLNRAILKLDPEDERNAEKLKGGVMKWAGLTEAEAEAIVAAWRKRPKLAKRLNMSRRAVRNLLTLMDRPEPWPDPDRPGQTRWLTQIEARKLIAEDAEFRDATTGRTFEEEGRRLWPKDPEKAAEAAAIARRRYAIGAKGATARDRHYMQKHLLMKNGEPIVGPDGLPLHEPPPAPLISNPVVRKAIHEVRRHLIEYMTRFGRKPDEVYVELSREARMGKKDADEALFRNRLRNRIKKDIIHHFKLDSQTSTQQEAAVKRVVLALQQKCVCPLCGKTMSEGECDGITLRKAASGDRCEVAHIIPQRDGGDTRWRNIVLAHAKCNQNMRKRTARQFWEDTVKGGFNEGIAWIEKIYGEIERPKRNDIKNATEISLWSCYFTKRDDMAKIEQFKKDIKDIQGMTARQEAATRYATRQVMAYLADALFEEKGLPERRGHRLIYATDGIWTSRLRRDWGLFFDPHGLRMKGLISEEEHQRKEKDRGDHRHHAIDAIVIALCSRQVQIAWEERERQADQRGINTGDEEAMKNYRRENPLPPPGPFKSLGEFHEAVRKAVFSHEAAPDWLPAAFADRPVERPICHRPVKRKLVGALHKATQYGPVIDTWKQNGAPHSEAVEGRVTVRQPILGDAPNDFLKPSHLRLRRLETDDEAVARLARRFRIGKRALPRDQAIATARKLVKSRAFARKMVDPKPEKGGIVRDIGLRRLLRKRIEERNLDPDNYSKVDLKKSIDTCGPLTMGPLVNGRGSGIPIRSVVLLWANEEPIKIHRDHYDYRTGVRSKLEDPATRRLYDSQNNHHIEIRAAKDKMGREFWSGKIVPAFKVARQLSNRLRKLLDLEKPFRPLRKRLTKDQRQGRSSEEIHQLSRQRLVEWKQAIRGLKPQRQAIIDAHPLVDRADNKDGRFVMSLCEGEMLLMRHKQTKEVGYFVVAKLDKPQSIVVVPHWDARSATGRKDAEGKKVADSKREQFAVTPADLKILAPPGHPHALKVRVSPLGEVTILEKD